MKRFIKTNLIFFIVILVFLLGALALLVMVFGSHSRMNEYMALTRQISSEIETLNNQSPAPHAENIKLIQAERAFFIEQNRQAKYYFGQVLDPALAKFVDALGVPEGPKPESADATPPRALTLDEFKIRFRTEWEGSPNRETVAGRDQFYQRFRRNWSKSWDKGLLVFEQAAAEILAEPVTRQNTEDILLEALGLPRNMGFHSDRALAHANAVRFRLMQIFDTNKVQLGKDANAFGFPVGVPPPVVAIVPTVRQWGITSDLASRIASSGISNLVRFHHRTLEPHREGDLAYYHYFFEVNGELDKIRNLVKKLHDAYAQNRVYIVRSIFVYEGQDLAGKILSSSDLQLNQLERLRQLQGDVAGKPKAVEMPPVGRRPPGPGGRPGPGGAPHRPGPGGARMGSAPEAASLTEAELEAQRMEELRRLEAQEKSKPYYERIGYGDVVLGGPQVYRALFAVDYVTRADLDLN